MDVAWKWNSEWPYRNGFKALHIAAAVGNADALLVLLQLGAHPNSTDSTGVTPMMVTACQPGYGTSRHGWQYCIHCWRLARNRHSKMRVVVLPFTLLQRSATPRSLNCFFPRRH
ncbi:ankyrin repeat protein [Ectocarpus siliculosus]|uniref:Ankyrin repeat protein n=1 Tax=Ectocarpus siliculosus TaxID=2880 RepID=D8LMA7_ECTSI|nr:ankyrin repeat protein [Ectocarpus siliculosus]|eukprot:CBN77517.1 ankyrin repeat protein [Ectocarpus siliculosus]